MSSFSYITLVVDRVFVLWDYSLPISLINIILSILPLKSCPCLGLLYVLSWAEMRWDVSSKIFLNFSYFRSIELFLTPHRVIRQSLTETGRGENVVPGLATITRRRGKDGVAAGSRYSLHAVLHQDHQDEGDDEDQQLLQCNIYDATPDHSILKHGLAKSLSNFHIGEFWFSDNLPLIWRPRNLLGLNLTFDLNSNHII